MHCSRKKLRPLRTAVPKNCGAPQIVLHSNVPLRAISAAMRTDPSRDGRRAALCFTIVEKEEKKIEVFVSSNMYR